MAKHAITETVLGFSDLDSVKGKEAPFVEFPCTVDRLITLIKGLSPERRTALQQAIDRVGASPAGPKFPQKLDMYTNDTILEVLIRERDIIDSAIEERKAYAKTAKRSKGRVN